MTYFNNYIISHMNAIIVCHATKQQHFAKKVITPSQKQQTKDTK